MATSILDTGEAYLPADEKQFVRASVIPQHIHRSHPITVPPAVTGAVVALAIAGLTVAAFAV